MWPFTIFVVMGVALWAAIAHAEAGVASARVKALSQFGAQWSNLPADSDGKYTIPAGAYFAMSVSSASPQAPRLVQLITQAIQSGALSANEYPPGVAPPTWAPSSVDPSADATNYFRAIGQVVGGPFSIPYDIAQGADGFPIRVFTSPTRPIVTFNL